MWGFFFVDSDLAGSCYRPFLAHFFFAFFLGVFQDILERAEGS